MKQKGNKPILIIVLFIAFLITSILRNEASLQGVIWSDTEGYYMYLPALFIQKSMHHVPPRSMNYRQNDKGELTMKYTCGVAYFYLPFFICAHVFAHLQHYDTSGFSEPYYYGMIVCGVFWSFVGIVLLRRLLRKYFDNTTTWITLLCVMLGTNFFHYATKWMGMSHNYSFVLTAALLLLTDEYYKKPKLGKLCIMALLFGWTILIRPTNCILILALLLLHISSKSAFRERLVFWKNKREDIAIAAFFLLPPMIPQLLYWKEVYDQWIVYSYKGEGFIYWNAPKMLNVLFDTQNGLFTYSPLLLLIIPGLIAGRKDRRTNSLAVAIVFPLITYVFGSWWAWDFSAAFGHRCYIEYLPILAFPLALTIERTLVKQQKIYLKILMATLLIFLAYFSVTMSIQYDTEAIKEQWSWAEWARFAIRNCLWR